MDEHQYQLVIYFPASSPHEFEELMRLLDSLTADLQTHPEILVDGYDFGLGAYNMFVHTNSPDETFPLVRASLERHRPNLIFTAGYRDFAEDDYVPMWPPTLEMFELR